MNLDKRKKELELARVKMAKMELELRIDERLEEVKKLESQIAIQDETILKIEKEINQLG